MIPTASSHVVKSDMLSLLSTVGEILRALYFYGADYLMSVCDKSERLLHKDQLVALMEQGRERVTLDDLSTLILTEPMSARMKIEDIPPEQPMLLFRDEVLSLTTFEDYRASKLSDARVVLPEWWVVPLPLIHIRDGRVQLNESANALIPGGASSFAGKIGRMTSERVVTVRWKKQESTFALAPLTAETYLLEDVSGDFEMAEDLLWWAAVGRAFVRRMEENGLAVKRLLPNEEIPQGSAEVIPCSWDGELIGKLALLIPSEVKPQVQEESSRAKGTAVRRKKLPAASEGEGVPRTELPKMSTEERADGGDLPSLDVSGSDRADGAEVESASVTSEESPSTQRAVKRSAKGPAKEKKIAAAVSVPEGDKGLDVSG